VDAEVANPMSRFPEVKRHRSLWLPRWEGVWVKVTAEDGTYGLASCSFGRPVAAVIADHFGPMLVGQEALAIERLWDMMFRMSKPYGTVGLASVAISGVDLALWDLAGKIQGRPVYELLGGKVRERVFAYATGNDIDWYTELGFKAVKLARRYGVDHGQHLLIQSSPRRPIEHNARPTWTDRRVSSARGGPTERPYSTRLPMPVQASPPPSAPGT